MKRFSIRLVAAAGLLLVLIGLTSPSVVQAKGQCASGYGTIVATSPFFSVQAGDVVTATITIPNSDTVEVDIELDHSSPTLDTNTSTATATWTLTSADHVAAQFIDFPAATLDSFFWSISINGGCPAGIGGNPTGPLFHDGRLNSHDGAETAAIYCDKGGVDIYYIGDPWKMVLKVTAHEIDIKPTHPITNTLIKENKQIGVALYRLTTGELQVNAPGGDDGKGPYVFIFADCPRN